MHFAARLMPLGCFLVALVDAGIDGASAFRGFILSFGFHCVRVVVGLTQRGAEKSSGPFRLGEFGKQRLLFGVFCIARVAQTVVVSRETVFVAGDGAPNQIGHLDECLGHVRLAILLPLHLDHGQVVLFNCVLQFGVVSGLVFRVRVVVPLERLSQELGCARCQQSQRVVDQLVVELFFFAGPKARETACLRRMSGCQRHFNRSVK